MNGMKPQRKTPRKPPVARKPKQTDPVEVYSRIRPVEPEAPLCVKTVSPTTIQLTPPEGSNAVRNGMVKESQYSFKYVFDEYATQKAIFDQMALPCVEDVLKGKNALLFAYGITSSGKTHTMTGVPSDQGVLPRCLDVIFNSIGSLQSKKYVFKPDKMNGYDIQTEADAMLERHRREILPLATTPKKTQETLYDFDKHPRVKELTKIADIEEDNNYSIFVSYVEIYNNYVYDLLEELEYNPITGYRQPASKQLREDSSRNMYVSGAKEVEVKSTEEAYEILLKGQKRRKVAHTALNTESSRSHSVFQIRLVQAPLDPLGEEVLQDKNKVLVSQLSLVDLAGSERTKRTGNQGDRLKEAGNINQSLMVLRTCIEALRENQMSGANKLVPYRDSKLTHLFKTHFDGEGKVRMIVCVNPKAVEYGETIHVMQFAELTQEVQVARSSQVQFDLGLARGRRRMNQEYKQAVAKAKEEGIDPVDIPIPEPMIYSLGEMFPILEISNPDQTHIAATLIEFLKERQKRRDTLLIDFAAKQESFREHLLRVERENVELKATIAEVEAKLAGIDGDSTKMQRRIRSLEKANDILSKTNTAYVNERRDLEREIDDKDFRIYQEKSEKDRLKQDYKARMALTEHQFTRQMEETRRKAKEAAESKVRIQKTKMNQIKNILSVDSESLNSAGYATTPARGRSHTMSTHVAPARSEPDLSKDTLKGAHKRAMTAYANSIRQSSVTGARNTPRARSPPPVKPKPVVNPARYHRRSRSAHEVWVDHRPQNLVDTNTVMQSKLRKKRSVTNLTEKDAKKATNYAITTQHIDSEGEIATTVVSGDVMRTSAGGTSVVFTNSETVKQRSPGDLKRRSPALHPSDFEGEWSDTEDRCRIAHEGHGHMKKIKTSQV